MRPNRKLGIQVAGEGEEEVSGFIIGGGVIYMDTTPPSLKTRMSCLAKY